MDEKKGYTKEQVGAFIDLMDEIEASTMLHPRYDKYWFCWNNLYSHLLNIAITDDVKIPEPEEEPEEEEDVENALTEEQIKEYLESLRKNKKEEKKEPVPQVKEVVKPKIKKEEVSLLDD